MRVRSERQKSNKAILVFNRIPMTILGKSDFLPEGSKPVRTIFQLIAVVQTAQSETKLHVGLGKKAVFKSAEEGHRIFLKQATDRKG